jgi:hypothetical protein
MKKGETFIVRSSAAEYLTFVAAGGGSETSVEMRYEDENIWLTQKMMATLYDVSVPAINQQSRGDLPALLRVIDIIEKGRIPALEYELPLLHAAKSCLSVENESTKQDARIAISGFPASTIKKRVRRVCNIF